MQTNETITRCRGVYFQFLKELRFWILDWTWQFFKGQYYLQTHRTTLGTPVVRSYANTFMAPLETEIFLNAHNGFIPLIEWIRYIDDIFAIWPHRLESIITSIISTLQSNSTTSTRKNQYTFSTRLSTCTTTTNTNWNLNSTSNRRTKHYYYTEYYIPPQLM